MFCCAAIAQFYCSSQQCFECGVGTSILHRERERELHGLTACKFQSGRVVMMINLQLYSSYLLLLTVNIGGWHYQMFNDMQNHGNAQTDTEPEKELSRGTEIWTQKETCVQELPDVKQPQQQLAIYDDQSATPLSFADYYSFISPTFLFFELRSICLSTAHCCSTHLKVSSMVSLSIISHGTNWLKSFIVSHCQTLFLSFSQQLTVALKHLSPSPFFFLYHVQIITEHCQTQR
jgi:hypothetical protein